MGTVAATAGGTSGVGIGAGGPGGAAPRLRGMLHAATFPAAVLAGSALTALGPTQPARLAAAVYSVACMALFGVSAAYHRSPQGSRRRSLLRGSIT